MKVFSVYGFEESGKTATIENIIKELKRRGYTVGYIKEVHYEKLPLITGGAEGDDDRRCWTTEAEVVAVRGCCKTNVIFPRRLSVEEILQFYDQDYVVIEGVTETEVPKILCARNLKEVQDMIDDMVFAISGLVANELKEYNGIPVMSAVDNSSCGSNRKKGFRKTSKFRLWKLR